MQGDTTSNLNSKLIIRNNVSCSHCLQLQKIGKHIVTEVENQYNSANIQMKNHTQPTSHNSFELTKLYSTLAVIVATVLVHYMTIFQNNNFNDLEELLVKNIVLPYKINVQSNPEGHVLRRKLLQRY